MQKKITINIKGTPVTIEFSRHALERLVERDITIYEATSLIIKLGEEILSLKIGEEFGIIDKELGIGLICSVNALDKDIFIDIITVLRGERIYFSRGMKILTTIELLKTIKRVIDTEQ